MSDTNANAKDCIRILRFEFSDALIEQVTAFARVHQYDDRKTYKDSWTQWLSSDELASLFNAEVVRLNALGYKGDVAVKLFKSGRYYFRDKQQQQQQQQQHKRRQRYVTASHALLIAMDDHIERSIRSNTAYTPAIGFSDFFKMHANDDVLKPEVARLYGLMNNAHNSNNSTIGTNVVREIQEKLKKTYKNRYFMMMQKLH
jgi:hypothetical protein